MKTKNKQKNKIPDGWEVKKLGEVCDFWNGKGHEKDISTSGFVVVNSKFVSSDGNVRKFSKEQKSPLNKNDIVMVMSDVPKGKAIAKTFLIDKDNFYTLNQRIGGFKSEKIESKFLQNLINRNRYFLQFDDGVNQTNLRKDDILDCPLKFPPLPEQKRIVGVLEVWDEVLEKLKRKIEIKKNIKKGLMQELLTGKRRIDGFGGEWDVKKIKDIFDVTRGNVLAVSKMTQEKTEKNIFPVYSSQTKKKGLTGFYDKFLYENAITWTTDGANAGDVNFREGKFYCTNVCGVLLSKNGFANQTIAELLNMVTKKYVSYVGNPKLMNNVMENIKINLPSLEEQKAIADILMSADEELVELLRKQKLIEEQKRFLLNNLISGDIRVLETRGV